VCNPRETTLIIQPSCGIGPLGAEMVSLSSKTRGRTRALRAGPGQVTRWGAGEKRLRHVQEMLGHTREKADALAWARRPKGMGRGFCDFERSGATRSSKRAGTTRPGRGSGWGAQ
jgi:hypothetical protein